MKIITISALIAFTIISTSDAQTRKAPVKKAGTKTIVKKNIPPPEPVSPLNGEAAGKYAKDFSNKMYYTTPVYGDKRRGLNVQISDWKGVDDDQGAWWYLIKLTLTWEEGTGGPWDWKNVKYIGTLVTDQYGCNTIYLIDEKAEPSVLGLIKRAHKLNDEQREKLAAKDDWTAGVQYYWAPDGCLN